MAEPNSKNKTKMKIEKSKRFFKFIQNIKMFLINNEKQNSPNNSIYHDEDINC